MSPKADQCWQAMGLIQKGYNSYKKFQSTRVDVSVRIDVSFFVRVLSHWKNYDIRISESCCDMKYVRVSFSKFDSRKDLIFFFIFADFFKQIIFFSNGISKYVIQRTLFQCESAQCLPSWIAFFFSRHHPNTTVYFKHPAIDYVRPMGKQDARIMTDWLTV